MKFFYGQKVRLHRNWNGDTYRSFKMRHICNKVTLSTFSIVQYLMVHKNEKWPRDNKGRNYCKLFPVSVSFWLVTVALWLAVARLSVFLPSPVAMLCTCLEASLLLGPRSALIPELRPEQMDLLILRGKKKSYNQSPLVYQCCHE